MTQPLNSLGVGFEERICRLEREILQVRKLNRWLSRAAIALLVGVCALAWGLTFRDARAQSNQPAGSKGTLHATRFVLDNERGEPRAVLVALPEGPSLIMYDDGRKERLTVGMFKNTPVVSMRADNPKARISMSATNAGSSISVTDENGKTRASLDVVKQASVLKLSDESALPRLSLEVGKFGPVANLFDDAGRIRSSLGTVALTDRKLGTQTHRSESSLLLFDANGKTVFAQP